MPFQTRGVGDAVVLAVSIADPSNTVTSVVGGNSTWTRVTSTADSSEGDDVELWLGTVTATGDDTITVSYAKSAASAVVELSAREFTAGAGPGTVWTVDTAGHAGSDTQSAAVPLPSLTPKQAGELYVGYAEVAHTATGGSTPGFAYDLSADHNSYLYDPDVTATVSPAGAQSPAGMSISAAALISATSTNPTVDSATPDHGPATNTATIEAAGSLSSTWWTGISSMPFKTQAVGDSNSPRPSPANVPEHARPAETPATDVSNQGSSPSRHYDPITELPRRTT